MTHALFLAAALVACPERMIHRASIDLPQAAGAPVAWQQAWTGADWVWFPADVCPVCGHQERPIPVETIVPRIICPHCGAVVPEDAWGRFNLKAAPLRRWRE